MGGTKNQSRPSGRLAGLQKSSDTVFFHLSLLGLFLAGDAVAGPGHGVQALGVDLGAAGDALPEGAFADAVQRALHQLQELALAVALVEEELLGIGVGGLVGDVLCSLLRSEERRVGKECRL